MVCIEDLRTKFYLEGEGETFEYWLGYNGLAEASLDPTWHNATDHRQKPRPAVNTQSAALLQTGDYARGVRPGSSKCGERFGATSSVSPCKRTLPSKTSYLPVSHGTRSVTTGLFGTATVYAQSSPDLRRCRLSPSVPGIKSVTSASVTPQSRNREAVINYNNSITDSFRRSEPCRRPRVSPECARSVPGVFTECAQKIHPEMACRTPTPQAR